MPKQSPLRLIKRGMRYEPRANVRRLPPKTRGVYVLYEHEKRAGYTVVYIGVAGIGRNSDSGMRGRLEKHRAGIKNWTHFSAFEVHDNITGDEIRELEALLLAIFRDDPRIKIANKLKGSTKLDRLLNIARWE